MRVKEIMKKDIVVIEPNLTLKEASMIMSKNNIGCLAIVKSREVSGIITERDVMKNIDSLNKKVSSIMKKEVISIEPDQHIESAADLMAENKIKRLLVIEDDRLVGVITATDIIAHSEMLNDSFLF